MRFGRIPATDAEGAYLAHSIRFAKGSFKKGRLLSAEDVTRLIEEGQSEIVAARLEPGDVHEDEAAAEVAEAVAAENVSISRAFTGRVNLSAKARGVVVVDRERLDQLNLVHESITLATLDPWTVVEADRMLATIKIIPLAAPRDALDEVCRIALQDSPLIRIAAMRPRTVGLIQTELPSVKPTVLDKTGDITRRRIEHLGGRLVADDRAAHEEADLAGAIQRLVERDDPEILLIAGASAIVDRRDVLPAAIEAVGGEVLHFGMPVDPGNLILLGHLRDKPVLGLPGCARSPKINGFDWVLERMMAGIDVTPRDVMLMGAGGFLAEIPSRPLPRSDAVNEPAPDDEAPGSPRVAAIVLAAGKSSRMGTDNKLLQTVRGKPMLIHALDAVAASGVDRMFVVTGHEAEHVGDLLRGRDLTVIHNPDHADGLSTSLKAGLRALPGDVDAVVVVLGDMPGVTSTHIDRLIAAFQPVEGRAICIPVRNGQRGNPVLWGRRFFDEMLGLTGDTGARSLIDRHEDQLVEVEIEDDGILVDIDTPPALEAANN